MIFLLHFIQSIVPDFTADHVCNGNLLRNILCDSSSGRITSIPKFGDANLSRGFDYRQNAIGAIREARLIMKRTLIQRCHSKRIAILQSGGPPVYFSRSEAIELAKEFVRNYRASQNQENRHHGLWNEKLHEKLSEADYAQLYDEYINF